MRRRVPPLAFVVLLAPMPACVPRAAAPDLPAPSGVTLDVESHSWNDIAVYAVSEGVRTRLGTVTAMRAASFGIPSRLVTPGSVVRLVAEPIGSVGAVATEALALKPGHRIRWTLERDLALSSVGVW
jgi:hypothetical protein